MNHRRTLHINPSYSHSHRRPRLKNVHVGQRKVPPLSISPQSSLDSVSFLFDGCSDSALHFSQCYEKSRLQQLQREGCFFFSAVIQKKENEGQIDPSSQIALGYVVETI